MWQSDEEMCFATAPGLLLLPQLSRITLGLLDEICQNCQYDKKLVRYTWTTVAVRCHSAKRLPKCIDLLLLLLPLLPTALAARTG